MSKRVAIPPVFPDLTHEHVLLAGGARLVGGMDEVGRGALAGPVSVGVCVVDEGTGPCPVGLTDSKVLTARARNDYVPLIAEWSVTYAVGSASSQEIDELGIVRSLRLAGQRALVAVAAQVGPVDVLLLDGSHDWLTQPQADLFELLDGVEAPVPDGYVEPVVHTRVKADLACASVAAASVVAKCSRDSEMTEHARSRPEYGWNRNKGYGSAQHVAALVEHGPSPLHRLSWRLPGGPFAATSTVDGP
ncbi:ribonuclease HII [Sanguibacter antarcticus]|uniref:Ribonuclease n=1 Tax=Sanguibacter antarcticus TaxID=372484 RepID=A0A2A9E5B1_9MICO|nr:ribonuclease HII [Sanguibacter antarcticus]PFG33555.1 RNase HII [Sanguibacter antarcticus]